MPTGLLERLSGGARTSVFLAALALTVAALFAPGWIGAALVVVIVAAMLVLMRHTWAVAPPSTRAMRVLVLVALAAIAIYKATR